MHEPSVSTPPEARIASTTASNVLPLDDRRFERFNAEIAERPQLVKVLHLAVLPADDLDHLIAPEERLRVATGPPVAVSGAG
jgi:hypothetical protein